MTCNMIQWHAMTMNKWQTRSYWLIRHLQAFIERSWEVYNEVAINHADGLNSKASANVSHVVSHTASASNVAKVTPSKAKEFQILKSGNHLAEMPKTLEGSYITFPNLFISRTVVPLPHNTWCFFPNSQGRGFQVEWQQRFAAHNKRILL